MDECRKKPSLVTLNEVDATREQLTSLTLRHHITVDAPPTVLRLMEGVSQCGGLREKGNQIDWFRDSV